MAANETRESGGGIHPWEPFAEPSEDLLRRWLRWYRRPKKWTNENYHERVDNYTEDLFGKLEQPLLDACAGFKRLRKEMEQAVEADADSQLDYLQAMIGWATYAHSKLLEAALDDPALPPRVRMAYAVITARALGAAQEVEVLLRSGLRHGALARWRLLYELAVFASILDLGNRHTCARYLNHEYVLAMRYPAGKYESKEDRLARQAMGRIGAKFIRRYGKEYRGVYGWAAQVTNRKLGVPEPHFHHLESLAPEAAEFHWLRWYANHSTHGDALGASLLREESGALHIGRSLLKARWLSAATVHALGLILEKGASIITKHATTSMEPAIAVQSLTSEIALTFKLYYFSDMGLRLDIGDLLAYSVEQALAE